ncbi:unnamed protein product [Ilex paraguariensis]|uniref:Serine-threonine/tyrosine-protein kinase catalytic domain-containing protein n=1 Tax=Ilex paraguariensis TaxID=185542 RepID=A0ABC8RXB4_9AQUA
MTVPCAAAQLFFNYTSFNPNIHEIKYYGDATASSPFIQLTINQNDRILRTCAGKASKESDAYSYGIVALEIACGRKPIDPMAKDDFDEEQLMLVGLWCAHPDHTLRPSINQAIQVLDSEAPLPHIPKTMPVSTYSASPLNMSAT